MFSTTAVRIASRYVDPTNPSSIHVAGRLQHYVMLSTMGIAVLMIWAAWMGHSQQVHRVVIHDVDVNFEFTCPPPEPRYRASAVLSPIRLEEGSRPAALSNADQLSKKQGELAKAIERARTESVDVKSSQHALTIPEAPVALARTMNTNSAGNMLGQPAAAATTAAPQVADQPVPANNNAGLTDGMENSNGAGGYGNSSGRGDQNSLAGGDFGISQPIDLKPGVALGNIGPYKKDIASRIKERWHPGQAFSQVEIAMTLDHDGKVLAKTLLKGTGNRQLDEALISTLENTEFGSLPDWYKPSRLNIRVVLSDT